MAKKITVEFTNERIIPSGGLAVVGAILGKSNFVKNCNNMKVDCNHPQHQIKNGDIMLTYIGMQCMGKPSFDAVQEMDDDPDFYKEALGICYAIPSAETLRQRLGLTGSPIRGRILDGNIRMLQSNGVVPSELPCRYVPVDMDVPPFDNSKTCKEGVSRTYKGCDGYAPMLAYTGREGYLANLELREGKQHCQKGTPQFLEETIGICRQLTDAPLIFRPDSGNDSAENIGILLEHGCYFIIKRNLRKESKEGWLKMAKENSKDVTYPREGKAVYVGGGWKEVTYRAGDGTIKHAAIRMGYEIIERTIDKKGQPPLIPDIEANVWWTNTCFTDREAIGHYHAHGESEQFHSELKTDMKYESFVELVRGKRA